MRATWPVFAATIVAATALAVTCGIWPASIPPPAPEPASAPAGTVEDETGPPLIALDRLDGQVDQTVRVRAAVMKPVGRLSWILPPTQTRIRDPVALVRYKMVCCAADASPVAIPVLGDDDLRALPDGTWIEALGRPRLASGELVFSASSWHRIETPGDPFIRAQGWSPFGGGR